MKSIVFFALTLCLSWKLSESKILTPCEAVQQLTRAHISKTFMSNWVCLMQSESGMNTRLITGPKSASSYSYGVFQINSAKWCTRGRRGGVCNKRCEDFADDDITDDIECAKIIQDTEGFKAWDGWMKKCKNKPLPDISNCRKRRSVIDLFDTTMNNP
ncbi:lysozyme-like [Prorops nasuta]|uniref:lysozyme-like n=1 Tax=Prorops nasuta TaxID=863751 RepID=UPI0034CFEA2F